jgi:TP901 family phage tail tape measure protein
MANDQELLIRINGTAKNFTDELDKAKKKTKDLEKALTSVAKVSTAAFVGLAGAVGVAVARFASFEKGFSNVVTLLDKGSFSTKTLSKGIDDLKSGVLDLSAKSGESLETLNEGLFNLVSSGVAAEQSIETLEAATQLAIAGATDTNTAVKALAATLTSFGDEAGTATEIAEKFFTAQKFGVTTVGELAKEFNKVAGISKNLGLSFDETLASLSSLTADGAKPTAEAATQLKAALNSIILVQSKLKNESAAVQDALSLQNIRQRGLVPSLELLKKATNGNIAEMQRLVGSSESLGVVLSLTGAQSELVAKQIDAMGDATERSATFQEALATKQATLDQATKRLTASYDAAAVSIGEAFAPTILSAAEALTAMAQEFNKLDKDTKATLVTLTKWTLAITGSIALLTTLAVVYLKARNTAIAFNAATGIGAKLQKLYNFTLVNGKKALQLFRTGMIAATTTVRGFAAATGIGLVLVALSLMITHMKETKAIALGTFASIKKLIENFSNFFSQRFGAISDILLGAFTFDTDKVKQGLEKLEKAYTEGAADLGKGVGDAFSDAYNQSIAESEAAELPPPEEVPLPEGINDRGPASKPEGEDNKNLEKLIAKEKEAAARIREIRARENELLKEQNDRAARDRIDIKDAELKKIDDAEKKAIDQQLKLKSEQINLLKSINKLENENEALSQKEKLNAKEQAILEANQRELEITKEQLMAVSGAISAEAEAQVLEQEERNQAKLDRITEQAEEEAALRAELNELSEEQRDLLDEEDLLKFQNQIQTKRDIEKQAAQDQLKENIARRNQFIKDEVKFGTDFAKLKQFFSSEEVKLADQTAGQLVQLQNSKNSSLKAIGKAAALTQIGIKTAQGAIAAYSSLAGIPIIGPALGVAAAGALVLYGAEQAAAVTSAQRGGLIPDGPGVPGLGGASDSQLTLTQPGELLVPAPLAPDFITAVGRPEVDNEEGEAGTNVVIGFTDEAIPFIEQKLLERRAIGTGNL